MSQPSGEDPALGWFIIISVIFACLWLSEKRKAKRKQKTVKFHYIPRRKV